MFSHAWRTLGGTLTSLLVLTGTAWCSSRDASQPNIVLIMTDDQGWWDVGIHGNKDIETPEMDRLAAEGVELTNFHAQPVCAPTRASLMTGRYYLRTGLYNTRFGGDSMAADEVTLAEVLQAEGYRTAQIGKWHLGPHMPNYPLNQGFDVALTLPEGHSERYYYPDQLRYNGREIDMRGHITNLLTDAAIEFVRNNKDRPFFLYLPYNVPHEPPLVPDEYLQKYLDRGLDLETARIYGLVTQCDQNIGRLLKVVDETGLREETIVIFLSDNGGISRHYKAGLRGNKGSAYEGGTRAPFFARWPGHFPAGAKVDAMASVIDILPTFCELVGAPVPEAHVVDGKSLLSILKDGKGRSPHDHIFAIWDRHRPRIDRSRWSIRGTRYKMVEGQLFDLKADPGEEHDIAAKEPEIAAELRQRFESWLKDVTAGRDFHPPPIQVGRSDENPVEIQASWARMDGTHVTIKPPGWQISEPQRLGDPVPGATINYTFAGYDWDTIDGWSKPGEHAWWLIDVTRPGTYEVTLNYGCSQSDAGGRFMLSIGTAKLTGAVEPTVTRDVYWKRTLGQLTLEKGLQRLTVEVISAPGSELMALNRIWLRKID